MRRSDLAGLPPVEMPEGYSLRTYRPGDEAAWAKIMDTGIRRPDRDWTPELVRERLIDRPQFDPASLFFIVARDGEPVATACAWTRVPGETEVGMVHMVCCRPEHRGRRLGYWVTLAVLHRFRERGFREADLSTDDFRLAAIRTYLDLGFEPAHTHPGDAERWLRVLWKLAEARPDTSRPRTAPLPVMPIGLVRNEVREMKHHGWEEVVSEVVVEPALAEALEGIEAYSHLVVVFWLHQVTPEQRLILKLHPRDRADAPLTGSLATHSQFRPNPIGLTTVRLLERRGNILLVQGLDTLDGTPVLDVKPWSGREAPEGEVVVPDWVRRS
jgi:tRNA-Thr(GGU) m(6)t(6)A37 methyltransferase TsaA